MNYRKKIFSFLAEMGGSPIAQAEAVDYLADVFGMKPVLIRREVRAIKQQAGHEPAKSEEEIEAACEGIYFFPADTYYVPRGDRAEYEPRRERDVDLLLAARGLSSRKPPGDNLSEVQRARLYIQSRAVSYAGPQTAHLAGPHSHGETQILVTRQPQYIEAAQGDPTPFLNLLGDLCGIGVDPLGETQRQVFCGWLAQWDRALHNTDAFIQGQVMTIGGAPGIGKNRFTYFLSKLGGDRTYEPSKSSTKFNAELLGSTLEVVHDSSFPDDAPDVREFWLGRKALVANADHRIEGKYINSRTMRLAGVRSIATYNLAPEGVRCMPPMLLEQGMADKVILLRGHAATTMYPQQGTPEGTAWVECVLSSLPAFLWHLRNEFTLPEQLRDVRYGVVSYHNPEIRAVIANSQPDAMLGEVIDSWLAQRAIGGHPGPWEGTMTELYDGLRNSGTGGTSFTTMCRSPQHLGHQIARLRELPGWQARITSSVTWIGATANQERKLLRITPA